MPTLTIHSKSERLTGFRYFWLKTVRGFNASTHCARCLIGDYNADVKADMKTGVEIKLDYPEGVILYLCGVSVPYRWVNNLHIAMRAKPGVSFFVEAYNGDRVTIDGAELITFDDRAARELYPERGKQFLTCRNFQFGAHLFRA